MAVFKFFPGAIYYYVPSARCAQISIDLLCLVSCPYTVIMIKVFGRFRKRAKFQLLTVLLEVDNYTTKVRSILKLAASLLMMAMDYLIMRVPLLPETTGG